MKIISLVRRADDCRVCGLPHITLALGGNVLLSACASLLIVGENLAWGKRDVVLQNQPDNPPPP